MAVKIVQKNLTPRRLVMKVIPSSSLTTGKNLLTKAIELTNAGAVLHITMTRIGVQSNDGKLLAQQSLKMAAVTLCMQGKLGTAPSKTIRHKVTNLINYAYTEFLNFNIENAQAETKVKYSDPMDTEVKALVMKHVEANQKIAAIKLHRSLTGSALKVAKPIIDKWFDEFWTDIDKQLKEDADDIAAEAAMENEFFDKTVDGEPETNFDVPGYAVDLGAKVVPLNEATMLHQPVAGTDTSSRYHVIALSESIALAIRYKVDHSVSIRAALRTHPNSKIAQQAKTALLDAGLEKKSGGHFSLHLAPESRVMAQKTIGAVLFGIGAFEQVSSQLHVLLDKAA